MPKAESIVDCHAHIIDHVRFPFTGTRGYRARPDESGTREEFCTVLDHHGVGHALLVQLSGYGTDNGAILDAVKTYPGRFKAIAVVDPDASARALEDLAAAGVVGVRFNLPSYDPDALAGPAASRLLQRLKTLGWFAQVYADDAQWATIGPVLSASGVHVLVDHFGVHDLSSGIDQKGFQAVLALGRTGNATVKFSALFRVSRMRTGFNDLDPFVEQLLRAFGTDRCVWGSDWPFINFAQRSDYADLIPPLSRWLPDDNDRQRVIADNARRLFGFGD